MPPRKRPAAVPLENLARGRERTGPYNIEFQRLLDLRSSRPLVDADRGTFEALMELRPSIVQNLGDNINLRKAFFVSSQSAVDSAVTAVVHYILLREALRDSLASMEDVAQRLHAAGVKYCKYFPSNDLAQAVSSLRLCNISPREDRPVCGINVGHSTCPLDPKP